MRPTEVQGSLKLWQFILLGAWIPVPYLMESIQKLSSLSTQTHKQNLNIGTKDQRSLYDSSSGDHEHLYRIYWKAIQ